MAKETHKEAHAESKNTTLTKFPDAEKANQEMHTMATLPSAFDLFKPSKRALQSNLTGFLVLLVAPLVLSLIGQGPHLLDGSAMRNISLSDNPMGIFGLLGGILGILAAPGVVLMQLKATRGEIISWQEAFNQGLKHFWRFLGLAIVTAILLTVAILALIVPFFILLPRVILAPYYVIDRNMGPIEALKASMADYKKFKGTWGLLGVIILLSLPGIVPVIGWLVANVLAVVYSVAPAIRYEQVKNLADGKPAQTPIEKVETATA